MRKSDDEMAAKHSRLKFSVLQNNRKPSSYLTISESYQMELIDFKMTKSDFFDRTRQTVSETV